MILRKLMLIPGINEIKMWIKDLFFRLLVDKCILYDIVDFWRVIRGC